MPARDTSPHIFTNLLYALVYKDLTQRYRRSLLGPAWAILQPLILMVVFNMLHGFMNIPSDGIPYVIFSYAALVPWTFFANAVMFCGPSIIQNAAIIKKISFPREVFPLSAVITALFDFCMSFIVLIGMMFWFHIRFSYLMLWAFPLVFITALLAFAIGIGVAALGTFKRDFIYATPFLLQFWMLVSPIIYPLSSVPAKWKFLYMLNPMAGIVEGFRDVLIRATPPSLGLLTWSGLVTLAILFINWSIFRRVSRYFADVM